MNALALLAKDHRAVFENVRHHIEEEEEGEMFDKARQVLDRQELLDLGDVMAARKRAALREREVNVNA